MSGRDQDRRPISHEEWKRFKVAMFQHQIERTRRLYAQYPNPIHAFQAYRMARAAKIDVPEWVLELFDQWAEALCVKPPRGAKTVADALGLGTKGGPSITSQAAKQARNLHIAERVLGLRDLNPERDMLDIFGRVAEDFNLSSDSVARIWYEVTRGVKY